ncbi:MAG: penicillin-binding protein activator [Myxococcota bacterium]|jgi:ABC-type branched-subunit amino acid transport system substrate-binding protein|nr:penicillin-binding protein activator [Myxococcota bacterium]
MSAKAAVAFLFTVCLLSSSPQALAQSTPKVAVLAPLSGNYSSLGKAVRDALEWVDGELLLPIEWVYFDTKGEASIATELSKEIAENPDFIALFGPVGQEESRQVVSALSDTQLPIIVLSSADGIEETASHIFRARVSAEEQSRALARFAIDVLEKERAAVFYPDDDYGRSCMLAFTGELQTMGLEPGPVEPYPADEHKVQKEAELLTGKRIRKASDEGEFKTVKQKRAKLDFDVLFIPDDGGELARIAPYLELAGLSMGGGAQIPLLGTSAWLTGQTSAAEGRLEGAMLLRLFDAEHSSVSNWVQDFYDREERMPTDFEAQLGDAALYLSQALRRCPDSPSRECVLQGLASGARIQGIAGFFSFSAKRSPVRELFVYVMDGNGESWRAE